MHPTCPLPTLAGRAFLQVLLIPTAGAQTVEAGPHRVGFRVLEAIDYSRSIGPKRDYKGAAQPGNGGMPLPVSVWYPAQPETGEAIPYGYAFVYASLRRFFDAYVKHDSGAAAWLQKPASEKGFADDIVELTRQATALETVPTPSRFADLLEEDLPEAIRIFRAARAENPDVDLVGTRTLDLMVFRALHRGAEDDVDRLNQLKREVLRK